jgi:predicted lactoylglutathione lyase
MSPAGIRLTQLNLVVTKVAASRDFYAHLGLDFSDGGDPAWAGRHVSAVGAGGGAAGSLDVDLDSASFAQQWNVGWPGGSGVVIGFGVPTRHAVDELVAELVGAGHAVQQQPYDAFWGARYAVVSDPDGNAVGIMSPPDDARRGPAPPPV